MKDRNLLKANIPADVFVILAWVAVDEVNIGEVVVTTIPVVVKLGFVGIVLNG